MKFSLLALITVARNAIIEIHRIHIMFDRPSSFAEPRAYGIAQKIGTHRSMRSTLVNHSLGFTHYTAEFT
ncbi:hypothetical protein BDV3_001609 [Batrachochytrium dendrobatidis]